MAELTELILDVDALTLGDLETIEDLTGVPFDESLAMLNAMKTKAVIAFVFILGRKTDPTFTLEEARATKLAGLTGLFGVEGVKSNGDVPADPPVAADV